MCTTHDVSCSSETLSSLRRASSRSHAQFRMSDCFFVRIPVPQHLLSVFATRIGTSAPHWQPTSARYVWDRFAAGTTPRLPSATSTSDRIRIPWPKRPERPKYERKLYFFSLVRCRTR